MNADLKSRVVEFVSLYYEIPELELVDDYDMATEIDWNSLEGDEQIGIFIEDFCSEFKVYDERFDFKKTYNGPWILYPLAWLRWRTVFYYPTRTLKRLKISDLVKMASDGTWDDDLELVD